jgi:hypothetical protein
MRSSALVLGYHGCDREVGERILGGDGHLRPSENDYDWLGSGIYFWEDNPRRALDWAEFVLDNPKLSRARIRDPFVVGAVIDPGNCLDLLETDSIRIVGETYQRLAEVLSAAGMPMPRNQRHGREWAVRRLDCAVVNHVHEFRAQAGEKGFDTVRAAFVEGEPLYPDAGFHRRTHIQLCVRSTSQIIGYFRPRGI